MPRATILTGSPGQQRYNDTTTVFGASLSHPALRSRQQMLYGNLVFDAICAVPPSREGATIGLMGLLTAQ